jgi:hypothetical protein
LVVDHGLLVVLVDASEVVPDSRLGNGLVGGVHVLPAVAIVATDIVLTLGVGGRCGWLGRRGRLRGGAEAGQEVGAAGARGRDRVLGDGADLGRGGQTQALQSGAFASRSETRGGHADGGLGLEVVVCHLSKTASVHAHFGILVELLTKGRMQQRWCAGGTRESIENGRRDAMYFGRRSSGPKGA